MGMTTETGSLSVDVEHVGGKWDGLTERRILLPNSGLARIVESSSGSPWREPEPGQLPWLVHEYLIEAHDGRVRFIYRGTRSAAVRPEA